MASGAGAKRLGFRTVLGNRPYLLWLASSNAATVGYSVYSISIVWLAYVATHSYAAIGLVLFVEYATYAGTFLLAPFADRVADQRTIYLLCYPIQAVAALALGLGAATGSLTLPVLLGLIFVISVLWDLAWAAYQAAPRLLLAQDELFAAGGIAGAIGGVNSIAGYASGGVLIVLVGAAGGMYLYAALLGLGAVLALGLVIRPGKPTETDFAESFSAGWRALLSEPGRPLLQLASVDAAQAFFTSGVALLITLTAIHGFAGSSVTYGSLFTTYVVGGVAAGLALGWTNPRKRAGVVMVGSLLASGIAFVLAGLAAALLLLAAVAWLAVGATLTGYVDAKFTFVRGSVEASRLARVSSNLYLLPGITSAVGALVLGDVAGGLSAEGFGLLLGIGFLGAGLLALLLPGVRLLRY